jgi:hypothetical protein
LVAIPYVGAGSAQLLSLGAGDVLVCALTEANCRNGSVCPQELQKLEKRGVRIFAEADLHAKVYVLGTRVIVGSANLSLNSRDALVEAGLYTSDRSVVKRTRAWFKDRLNAPATPNWLEELAKIYRPPKGIGVHRAEMRPTDTGRVWLIETTAGSYPKSELEVDAAGRRSAKRSLENGKRYKVETIRWAGEGRLSKLIKKWDVIIELFEGEVYPHGRVLNVRRSKTSSGGNVAYIYYELPKDPNTVAWVELRRRCNKIGLRLPKTLGKDGREIRVGSRQLLKLLSPEKVKCTPE